VLVIGAVRPSFDISEPKPINGITDAEVHIIDAGHFALIPEQMKLRRS